MIASSMPCSTPPPYTPAVTNTVIRSWRWTRLFFHIALGVLITGTLFPRINTSQRAQFVQRWSAALLKMLNVRLAVHGAYIAPLQTDLIIVANHISWLDIFVINAVRPSRFVAKAEIRDWPIVGWLCDKTGTIFIRRTRRSDTAKINQTIHDALAAGDAIGLFPEGTTTDGKGLHKFHTSLFEPAAVNAATVAPAVIRYTNEASEHCVGAAFIGELSFIESLSLIIQQPSIYVSITFAPTIRTEGKNRRELATLAESAIALIMGINAPHERAQFQNAPG